MDHDSGTARSRLHAALEAWRAADDEARLFELAVRKALDLYEAGSAEDLPGLNLVVGASEARSRASDRLALVLALMGSEHRTR